MKKLIQVVIAAGLIFIAPGLSQADVLQNGDFSIGPNGLNWWVRAPESAVSVNGAGQAVISTLGYRSGWSLISLYQTFDVPSLANTISLDVGFSRGAADNYDPGSGFPDFLHVSYFDATDISGGHDLNFLDYDFAGLHNVNGTTDLLANGMFRFTTDISSIAGRSGILYFDLKDGNDRYFSTAKVDNINFANTNIAPVPEPGTMLLLGSGLAGLAATRRKRNK